MALSETTDVKALMEANGGAYDIEQDPLWNGEQRSVPSAFERKEMAFYRTTGSCGPPSMRRLLLL